MTLRFKELTCYDLPNEPNYQHIPPSSLRDGCSDDTLCVVVFFVVIGHQPSTPADRFAAATAFAVLHACDTVLVAPAAASVDSAAAIRDATRLVSATAAVRHG
eukprot:scaffold30523_cov37-Cyclotella_meneghiniana.AAC.1